MAEVCRAWGADAHLEPSAATKREGEEDSSSVESDGSSQGVKAHLSPQMTKPMAEVCRAWGADAHLEPSAATKREGEEDKSSVASDGSSQGVKAHLSHQMTKPMAEVCRAWGADAHLEPSAATKREGEEDKSSVASDGSSQGVKAHLSHQ